MSDRYVGDCATHACQVAERLLAEGKAPWIGRVRHAVRTDGQLFHTPLIPSRYRGRGAPAWNTHYLACSGVEAYDPLVGRPTLVEDYATLVFGLPIAVELHLDVETTRARLLNGDLRKSFPPRSASELI